MNFTSIGDLSNSLRFRYLDNTLKLRANRLGLEVATGKAADITRRVNGRLDSLAQLQHSAKMLKIYRLSGIEMATQGEGMQAALGSIQTSSEKLGQILAVPRGPATAISNSASAGAALSDLRSAVGALNTQVAGRSLFSGVASEKPAVKPADDILDDLVVATASAVTLSDVKTAIDSYFDDPAGGYATSAYLGSTVSNSKVDISDSESVVFSPKASDTKIRNILKGMAAAALVTRGVLAAQPSAQAQLLNDAGKALLSANDGLTSLRASIGAVQERIDLARVSGGARATRVKLSISNLVSIDGYEAATQFQATQSSLEALYITTSRLSQLSLTKYLR